MQMQEFVGQVQSGAQLADMEQALSATRATLETLAERLGADDSRHLAARLPDGISHYLGRREAAAEDFTRDEFLKRVSDREGVDLPVSVNHARAVLGTLRHALPADEIRDVLKHLPDDFAPLFAESETVAHVRYGSGF